MRRLFHVASYLGAARWPRVLLLVALSALVGLVVSLAPVTEAARAASFCTNTLQCPPGEVCCPFISTSKQCAALVNGRCPFCTDGSQCPTPELCCPIGGPSNLKRCIASFGSMCPPVA